MAITRIITPAVNDDAVTLAKMASGTDGNIISYDASGNPVAVATGNDGQVLTSAGAGAPPVFETLPVGGITEADWWRITTEFTGSAVPIGSNWERCDTANFGKIGTGVSQSSGIFSFPSTGVWQMLAQQGMYFNGSIRYARLDLETTVDNASNWVTSGSRYSFINNVSGNTYSGMNCNIIFNCSNISTHKFRMSITKESSGVTTTANSGSTQTGCMFIRLGDSV